MKTLSIDIETYSSVDLAKCGVYKYTEATDFDILLFGYSADGNPVQVVDLACGETIPPEVIAALTNDDVTKWAFNAQFERMSPPTKELMKLVLEERIAHGGHPVLRWMMDNIYVRNDPAGNIKPDKEKSTEKIDGAVATVMALDRAIRCGNDTTESVYDTRGLLFL